jgi:DNA-binding Lrp family transcriptional regulator
MSYIPDHTDKLMLSQLERNARISNAELAERVNLSPTPCLRRLRRLEKLGFIRNYTAILNEKALGLQVSAFVFVNLDKNTLENSELFEAALHDLPEVTEVCVVAGSHDYVLKVITKDLEDYERFLKQRLAVIKSVADLESIIILKQSMYRSGLPI